MTMAIKIFFCYAHEDELLLNKLKKHLRPLQRQSLIDVWHDRDISAGAEWEQEINERLDTAQIIILLVSPDFMDSDYCYGIEMKRAIDRHERREVRVIPVILHPVHWRGGPLGKLQALPKDAIPVTDPVWHDLDTAFFDVTEGIRKAVEDLTTDFELISPSKESLVSSSIISMVSMPSTSQNTDQSWIGGAEIVVEGKTYWLHDPIEETWSPDRSVVQRRAKAQQSQTNRKVWLKQVQVLRSTSTANTLRNALRQEGQLLEELEQERRRDFPRLLASHRTERSVIIVYDSTQGSPLTQVFGPKDAPLDVFSARALLRSMQSLCSTLNLLHRRHLAHRALAPETIFLQDGRHAVLQDVGLATRAFELGEGPELYQAPEQIRRTQDLAVPGPYTDIYQLGVVLYHILTGCLPSSSPLPVVPPSGWNNAFPQELDAVLLRAINHEVKTRWHNIHEFSNALKQAMN